MKFLFDFFPVLLFFGTYQIYPVFGPKEEAMFYATAVVIVATLAQILWVYFRSGKVGGSQWVNLAVVVLFGGATLLFHDKTYIMWKPSILYWSFALGLVVSATVFDRNLIRAMMHQQVNAPDSLWQRLNFSWAAFFAAMGGANLYVATHFSESAWVNFKMFGTLGLMLVFILAQGVVLAKYVEEKE